MSEPVVPEYVICMYIRLSSEDDDIKYNDAKNESNSITAQRKMLYDYISSRIELADIKMKCMMFLNMREVARNMNITQQKTLEEQIQSLENTLMNIENAWKNIYSEYADRKISKEDYLEKTKEYKGKKQSLDAELTHLMAKKEQSVLESKEADVVELLIKKFCDADTLTEEMKELLIEKILVYSNNVLEIYWKADFIKYFSDTSRIIGKETGKNE